MKYRFMFGCLFAWMMAGLPAAEILTQHNDLSRTGANLQETTLTPANVNPGLFGKLFSRNVDGALYAQPLYVEGLTISSQSHNVVFVCTEHNSVYAFDADDPAASNALWHVNLGPSVPYTDVNSCGDLKPEIGITSTPVIDLTTGTIYVEAKTKETNGVVTYYHRLHALDLTNGQEKFGGPVVIQGAINGITFNALHGHQRAGLVLLSNVVYVAMSSHCDWEPYNGWLFGFNATNLSPVASFNTTPASANGEGAIWSCGMAPAADTNGNLYVMTGNGTFDANTGGTNYGMCFLRLSTTNGLAVVDWFSPFNEAVLSAGDRDLGSGGPVLLPGTHLLTGMGKNGTNYLVDQNNLGHFSTGTSDTNIVQEFLATVPVDRIGQSPVYWNGPTNPLVFMSCGNNNTLVYLFNGSTFQTTPLATSSAKQGSAPGGVSLSANNNTNGILWVIDSGNGGTLRAYNAANMPDELWDSQQNAARDALGGFVKFCSPTIADGKVFAPTTNQLVIYGLLSSPTATLLWTGASGSDTNWSTALNWTNLTLGGYGPPGPQNTVLFSNTAAMLFPAANSVVDGNNTIASLQYANNATNTSPNYQVTLVADGQTLTVTNGLFAGTGTDAGSNSVVNSALTGAGGTLVLDNGDLSVNQGGGGDGAHQAVLDLSGLGNLVATNVSRLGVGVYQLPAGAARAAGTLYLARTNTISLTSTGVTNGILVGWNDSQGNGNSSGIPNPADLGSTLYLGQTNVIFTDAIYVGTDKSLGCLLAFNPNGLNQPTAYIRGIGGVTSRVSSWGIGDTSMKNNSNQSASGTNDFSGGAVDALVGNMTVGVSQTGASSSNTGNGTGVLTFNAGIIDVNSLTNGWSVGSGTNGTDMGAGTVNVNGSAMLKVNSTLALAENTGTGAGVPSGILNVNNGTVLANSIVAGSGLSSLTLNSGTLILTNTAGNPGSAITSLSLSTGTLHLNADGANPVARIAVATLTAAGLNPIQIDSLADVTNPATNSLIAYTTFTGSVSGNFELTGIPAGYAGTLVDNSAGRTIDLVSAASTTVVPRFTSLNLVAANLVFGGTNGLPHANYRVLSTTNVALPPADWTVVATNRFDGSGDFDFTNGVNAQPPQQFYRLQFP